MAEALRKLVGYKESDENKVKKLLKQILEKKRGKLEKIEIENPDYDEELAKIGKKENKEEQKQTTLEEATKNKK